MRRLISHIKACSKIVLPQPTKRRKSIEFVLLTAKIKAKIKLKSYTQYKYIAHLHPASLLLFLVANQQIYNLLCLSICPLSRLAKRRAETTNRDLWPCIQPCLFHYHQQGWIGTAIVFKCLLQSEMHFYPMPPFNMGVPIHRAVDGICCGEFEGPFGGR